jgi:hypothetical protein
LRNIFDQYSQAENRVTHALLTALNEDRLLLKKFLAKFVGMKLPCNVNKLKVFEQQFPNEAEISEDKLERYGIPDGWIVDDNGWCVFIESKVLISLKPGQIDSHYRTAIRRGYRHITAVTITQKPPRYVHKKAKMLLWREIYSWLRGHDESAWARRTADYLEIAEAKLIESEQFTEGSLTKFAGFPFGDHTFTYLEGKRVMALAMDDLRTRRDLKKVLNIHPERRRKAIKGRKKKEHKLWDYIPLSVGGGSFTGHPHLTLGVGADAIEAMVTIPNAVKGAVRRNLKNLGEEGFQELVEKIVDNLKPLLREHKGAAPWFRGIQRRYPTQSSKPFNDATLDFDLRTAISGGGAPKNQPRWLAVGYNAFVNKKGSNYQMQLGVIFRYEYCPELVQDNALDMIARAWLACKPLVDLGR